MIHTVLDDFLYTYYIKMLIVPLNRHGRVSTMRTEPSGRALKDPSSSRPLGNSDITKLLEDLDNQTEAIKTGQEIGEELLGEKNHTRLKEDEVETIDGSLFGKFYQKLGFGPLLGPCEEKFSSENREGLISSVDNILSFLSLRVF